MGTLISLRGGRKKKTKKKTEITLGYLKCMLMRYK